MSPQQLSFALGNRLLESVHKFANPGATELYRGPDRGAGENDFGQATKEVPLQLKNARTLRPEEAWLRVAVEIAQGLRQAFSEGETLVGTAGAEGLDPTEDRLTLEISIHYPKGPRT